MGKNPKSLANLNVYTSDQDREAASRNGRKGGLARAAQRRAIAAERDRWRTLLSMPMKDGKIDGFKSLQDANGKNLKLDDAMKVKIISEFFKRGDPKMYELIMTMAGLKSEEGVADEQEQEQQDTGFMDALNAKAEEVWQDAGETDNTDKTEKE